ncbi:type VI secretion system baseplate subunit TssE [Erwinia endophytica]|uniref:type VI secretion system baseplate subunit TssE n=1 Tax=Erwinia endophytica TaxID=1563158 RepID=UPI001265EA6F|nr:type VI secretion system baseplate subunit TssE [Erwinia endophytica]KAB8305866.1 type VI secretion system baseplate subunit TssE [Erwinia endophytica]
MEKKQYFLPTLFERLLDDEPKKQQESYDAFYFDAKAMRAVVQKDISSVLNNTNIEDQLDEHRHKAVCGSVMNYGIAALVGRYANHHNWNIIEKNIRNALLRFESRIIPESLLVRPLIDKNHPGKYGMVLFEIRGLIAWHPHPIDLCISVAYDVETAKVDLKSV